MGPEQDGALLSWNKYLSSHNSLRITHHRGNVSLPSTCAVAVGEQNSLVGRDLQRSVLQSDCYHAIYLMGHFFWEGGKDLL